MLQSQVVYCEIDTKYSGGKGTMDLKDIKGSKGSKCLNHSINHMFFSKLDEWPIEPNQMDRWPLN